MVFAVRVTRDGERSQPFPWPALVLTAGLATRLQPLSSVRAKAALPVAGTPLVMRILRQLRDAGITRVVLNLHHRADSITRIVGDGSSLGLEVRYSWETERPRLGRRPGARDSAARVRSLPDRQRRHAGGRRSAGARRAPRRDQRAGDDGGGGWPAAVQRRDRRGRAGSCAGSGASPARFTTSACRRSTRRCSPASTPR